MSQPTAVFDCTTVVFDLGNVLIGWDPRRLYRRIIPDDQALRQFLETVCTPEWHDRQDRGGSCADATAELVAAYPQRVEWIEAFYSRWWEMFEPMPASVDVLRELRSAGTRLLALTNWPREMFVEARDRYPFLRDFEGIVVSGEEGVAKPDSAIFRMLLDRYDVDPQQAVYIDDKPEHVATASGLGLTAYRFSTVDQLRRDLRTVGLPVDADVTIRSGEPGDLPQLTDIYNHYVGTTAATFDVQPFAVEQRREWLRHYSENGRHRLLVAATVDGHLLGYATSSPLRSKPAYDTSVEVTVYLGADARGRGVGSMLYQELFAALASEDVHRGYAAVALPNDASVALHRRFGFVDVGVMTEVGRKFDQWWDVLWLERPLP